MKVQTPEQSPLLFLLDRPIAFHRALVPVAGSILSALMLSHAVYWSKRTEDEDGWFYRTSDEWRLETGMTGWEQEAARKLLRSRKLFEEKLTGDPATLYFRVNFEEVERVTLLTASWRDGASRRCGDA